MYLRITNTYDRVLVSDGLKQALAFDAECVNVQNSELLSDQDLEMLLSEIICMGYDIMLNIPCDSHGDRVDIVRKYVSSKNVGVYITMPSNYRLDSMAKKFENFTAEVSLGTYIEPFDMDDYVKHLLFDAGFRDVKFLVQAHQLGDITRYFEIVEDLKVAHVAYGERVKAMIPPIFLTFDTLALTRCICNFKETIGILSNGQLVVCGLDISASTVGPHLKDTSLKEGMETYDLFNQMCCLTSDSVKGVCKNCVFFSYCLTLCPAANYSHTGSFLNSYVDCQYLYDMGFFNEDYLVISTTDHS